MRELTKEMFDYNMRILKQSSETVTLTLKSYEDMKRDIQTVINERDDIIHKLSDIMNKERNFELSDKYFKITFNNDTYIQKKGVNIEIDQLNETIEALREKLNKKQTFIQKMKNLFKL